jgi:periplasmic protein CpxP/Spy
MAPDADRTGTVLNRHTENPTKMTRMKNKLKQILFAGAMLMAPFAMAQDGGERHHKDPRAVADMRTKKMVEHLSLTPEQTERVQAINLRHAEQMNTLRTQHQNDMEARKAAMIKAREDQDTELKQVLTPEQAARMDAMQDERRQRAEEKGMERRKGDQPRKEASPK